MDFEFLVQNIIISLVTIRNEALDNQKIDLKTQMQWYEQGAVACFFWSCDCLLSNKDVLFEFYLGIPFRSLL